ncbi:hypothetical protein [Erythrobacter sp.]|uniref:hypothetical protein n=1 Tax=Erythrobacter sp. TaxID=1042 RepID=UPI0025F5A3FB|nr:hypothetical protein [Erythrobacter sp.]
MSAALPFALAALIPALIGPLPAERTAITAKLCNGGTITIPLDDKNTPGDNGNCDPKACHAGNCRDKDRPERAKRGI